jgi:hypothetical protein
MAHDDRPTPPPALVAPPPLAPRDARALIGTVLRVTYPYVLGGGIGYLALTVVSRDLSLMCAGALFVLYGAALSKALQGQGPSGESERGTHGA